MTPARRVSVALLALAGTFGGLDLAQRLGLGTHYQLPQAPRGTPAAPLALKRDAFKLPAWADYAVVLERPIFNEDRKPTPVTEVKGPGPDEVVAKPLNSTLTSVIITPSVKLAIVKDNETGNSEVIRIGRPLPGEQNGWTLVELSPRGATFEAEGKGRQALELAVNETSTGVSKVPGVVAPDASGKPPEGAAPVTPPPETDAAGQARAEEIRRRIEERRRQLREEAERMRSEQTN